MRLNPIKLSRLLYKSIWWLQYWIFSAIVFVVENTPNYGPKDKLNKSEIENVVLFFLN